MMNQFSPTPSQTVGPFFAYCLTAEQYGYAYNSIMNNSLVDESIDGERIYITGQVFDGLGNTVNDAIIELIQHFGTGDGYTSRIARLGTGTTPDHRFTFSTIKPKSINGQAPHINLILMMRGSLQHLYTRLYFSDEEEANQTDSLLSALSEDRRHTLIARRKEQNNQISYEFNIRVQGADETVFLKYEASSDN